MHSLPYTSDDTEDDNREIEKRPSKNVKIDSSDPITPSKRKRLGVRDQSCLGCLRSALSAKSDGSCHLAQCLRAATFALLATPVILCKLFL